jgi:hypothetical protein
MWLASIHSYFIAYILTYYIVFIIQRPTRISSQALLLYFYFLVSCMDIVGTVAAFPSRGLEVKVEAG